VLEAGTVSMLDMDMVLGKALVLAVVPLLGEVLRDLVLAGISCRERQVVLPVTMVDMDTMRIAGVAMVIFSEAFRRTTIGISHPISRDGIMGAGVGIS
jgi:hypothetical protein